ncbi:FAD-dependent oxidoreductase [Candidatus Saccharibacteria bacterium]|nr:FAD-dependent oxidoreductase [Candidatus Saccharibacteria bacterium]
MKEYDIVIVGAGIAGLTAAIYAVRAGKSVLILEERVEGGQIINTINIENWPGDLGISGVDLIRKITAQTTELGAEIEYEEVVNVSQENDGFLVKTEDAEYLCKALIIASGTEPRKLGDKMMNDVGKRPVSYCATCDGALYKGKKVVVVGHGNTAKHEVKYLEGICEKVYNIHHDDKIPEDAEAVFVAIGRLPLTSCFKGLVDVDEKGYIVAGEDCHTSLDGVFVAGDCRVKELRQLVTAAADGAIAATEAVKYLADE